jgi:molybdenum-dependent DNA-binding transcriptional regulator ModE
VKSSEEIMEILEAFDLTGGLRAAAALVGCDHKTVAHYVSIRAEVTHDKLVAMGYTGSERTTRRASGSEGEEVVEVGEP